MATWEDGPEYAPLVRPDAFTLPESGPLSYPAPELAPLPPAPPERPQFTGPETPVADLGALGPTEGPNRDPAEPFAVASSVMTASDSAWSAAHWTPPIAPSPLAVPPAGPPALPVPAPVPAWTPPPEARWSPTVPPPAGPGPAPGPSFPAPGTPQWFTPWSPPPPAPVPPVTARRILEAATPGLCITLAIGGLIYVLAPLTLLVAFGLSPRVKVATEQVRRTFAIGLGAFAFFAMIGALGALLNGDDFGDWWAVAGTWALVISWAVLIITLLQVARGLRAAGRGTPPWR